MKSFKDMRNQIDEVLKKSDDISKWISDFVHSDDPKFAGKSKEEVAKITEPKVELKFLADGVVIKDSSK